MLAAGYAWIATGLRPFTLPALLATLGGGIAVVIAGWRPSPPVAARPEGSGAWLWGALGVGAVIWELQAFLQRPRNDHPTLSSLSNDLLQSHSIRAGAMLVWLATGWWLARR